METSARLFVNFFLSTGIHGQFNGVVAVVQPELLVVKSSTDPNAHLQLSIKGCRFVHPEEKGDLDAFADAESTLILLFPNGERCTIIAHSIPN